MARLQHLCLKAIEPLDELDLLGVKRGIAFVEPPRDPLRDMEGDGASGEPIEPGVEGVIMLVDCNMAGAWLEDKTTNVSEKISMSMTRETDMILS